MGAEHWDAQVGSVADEATRLLESLRRSAAEAAGGAAGADRAPESASGGSPDSPPAGDPDDPGAGTASARASAGRSDGHEHASPGVDEHDPVCQWCPICRGAAVARSLSPQTLARLADLASLAATVLTDLASARAETARAGETGDSGAAGGSGPATGTGSGRTAARPAPSRPIPVRDADDPQEAPRG